MGDSYNKEAYKAIYKHSNWDKTAREFEQELAIRLYNDSTVKQAAKTALTSLGKKLNAFYKTKDKTETKADELSRGLIEATNEQFGVSEEDASSQLEITDVLEEALLQGKNAGDSAGQVRNMTSYMKEAGVDYTEDQMDSMHAVNRGNLHEIINVNGNLREQMTLLYNGFIRNGGRNASQIGKSRSFKNMMVNMTSKRAEEYELSSIDVDALSQLSKYRSKGDIMDNGPLAKEFEGIYRKREGKGGRISNFFRKLGRMWTSSISNSFNFGPFKSERVRKFRNNEDKKKAALGRGYYKNNDIDLSGRELAETGKADGSIGWQEGEAYFEMLKKVDSSGFIQTAGPSGTTNRMMAAYKLLGASQSELLKFRLALIAWMGTSHDHSLFEIMTGSHVAGVFGEEDLSEPATMYQTISPIPLEVLRSKYTKNGELPHETIYRQMVKELEEKRKANYDKQVEAGKVENPEEITHFSIAGDRMGAGGGADSALGQDLAINIYTTQMYKLINNSRKYGSLVGWYLMKTGQVDYKSFEDMRKKGVDERNNSDIMSSIKTLAQITSRMTQDTLAERGSVYNEEEYAGDKKKTADSKAKKDEERRKVTDIIDGYEKKLSLMKALKAEADAKMSAEGGEPTAPEVSTAKGKKGSSKRGGKRDSRKDELKKMDREIRTLEAKLTGQKMKLEKMNEESTDINMIGEYSEEFVTSEKSGRSAFIGTTFRGGNFQPWMLKNVGTTFTTDGLLSSSLKDSIAGKFAKEAKTPVIYQYDLTGKGAVNITALSNTFDEYEVLIPEGTTFRIDGIEILNDEKVNEMQKELSGVDISKLHGCYFVRLTEIDGPGNRRRK